MVSSNDDPDRKDQDLAGLAGAFVVLGVTGGIAAYKAVELCRRLVEAHCHVVPVLTEAAQRFVGAVTFSALASEPAKTSLFEDRDPIPHTRLGQAADLVIVAPATARLIGEYAAGISADLLGATLLATRAPVLLCPAMHTEMWQHQAVQDNLSLLRARGVEVLEPASGSLAGGDLGEGRLPEPATILANAARLYGAKKDLLGWRVLISAGGTREPIDPVRYIANRSSGKQGHALAAVARSRGASVTLVTAASLPVAPGVRAIAVESAAQLAEAVLSESEHADLVVMAAAVADFRPKLIASDKLKRSAGIPSIELEATEDVLKALVSRRRSGQILIGFAAETKDVLDNAAAKLKEKGVDLLVVNDVSKDEIGFGHDTNAVTILDSTGARTDVGLAPKSTIAAAVLDAALRYRARTNR